LKNEIRKELPKGIETVFFSSYLNQGLTELKDLLWHTMNKPKNDFMD
jgi:GTP-binding protein